MEPEQSAGRLLRLPQQGDAAGIGCNLLRGSLNLMFSMRIVLRLIGLALSWFASLMAKEIRVSGADHAVESNSIGRRDLHGVLDGF